MLNEISDLCILKLHKEASLRRLRNSLDRHIISGRGDDITLHAGSVSLW